MLVRLCVDGDHRSFEFSRDEVDHLERCYRPDTTLYGFSCVYGSDSDMFQFLDSQLSPSCVEEVRMVATNYGNLCSIYFDCQHIDFAEIASRLVPFADDPFC